jgi:hypothetical protein
MSKKLWSNMLRMPVPGKALVLALGLTGLAFHSEAIPVTVQEVGVGPNEVVEMTSSTLGTHWVYAGIIDLKVNGVATDSFCIDPFHWSISGPQAYNTETLGSGPKSPGGPMGAATALKIEQLWAQFYSHTMSNQNAAGLQIAIWELVGGVNFQLNSSPDYGAGDMLAWVNSHPDATAANLIAVTGPGQDYVIPNVPDAAQTALLLGLAATVLFVARANVPKLATSKVPVRK